MNNTRFQPTAKRRRPGASDSNRKENSETFEVLANSLGLPLSYVQAIDAALDEGISSEELQELSKVRVKRHKPGDDPKLDVKYRAS